MEYIYLVASLPRLELTTPPRLSSERTAAPPPPASCEPTTGKTWARCSATGSKKSRAPEFAPFRDAETQLRNALARLRAARAGVAYDPGAHPHGDYDARCDEVAGRAMELDDPLARELLLDEHRWALLDEIAVPAPYGIQGVLAYGVKLRLAEKWTGQIDAAEGLRVAARLADEALAGSAL